MNTVIKGTKTIAEYKRVREDMENLARANYARHKEAFEEWGEGEPVKAWFDFEGNFCIEYESGKPCSFAYFIRYSFWFTMLLLSPSRPSSWLKRQYKAVNFSCCLFIRFFFPTR